MRTYFFIVVGAIAALTTASARSAIPALRAAELQDQYGKARRLTVPSERVLLLALADREGCAHIEDWIRPLYERYRDQIDIVGVAVVKGVPPPFRPLLRAAFRSAVQYPILLDWEGKVSESLQYEPRQANVFIIEPSGSVVRRFLGAACPSAVQTCFTQIDELLEDAARGAAPSTTAPHIPALDSPEPKQSP